MSKHYDAAVIGAGHNGLAAANYLARSGKSVRVLEAQDIIGGAYDTEELTPGAKWSSCAFVQGMLRPEIIADLELEKFGLNSHSPDIQGIGLWEDGDHVLGTYTIAPLDLERTYGLSGGNIFQGSMDGLENLFSSRNAPGSASYRTPVEGLYLCGAGVHPGGGVTGAPGHNAAKRVLADMAGDLSTRRRATTISKSFVDQMLATGIGKELGFQVVRSKAMRGATRFFSRVKK